MFVQCSDVANDVQNQTGRPERMEVDHISNRAIRQRRTKNGDIVLWQSSAERARERRKRLCVHFVCPVVYGLFVVDLLAQATDERARGPYAPTGLLLCKHRVQYGCQPVLEFAVVIVRHDEVSNTVHAASAQVCAVEGEISEIGFAETFDEVLLDAAGGGDEARDVLVLHEVQNDFAKA